MKHIVLKADYIKKNQPVNWAVLCTKKNFGIGDEK